MKKRPTTITPNAPSAAPMRRAVGYARVSSKEQEREGYSVPAQLALIGAYASEHELTLVREFRDVETAKQAGRTGFNELVAFLKRQRHPDRWMLLVEKTDRLYRNARDWVTLDELGVQIHFIKENVIYSKASRSSKKFVHGIKVLMAKNFIDNLSEETRKGQQQKAAQGFWPSCAPLGYRNVTGPDGRRLIEPDPDRAPLVTRVFECYATGRYSLTALTALANADGLRSRNGRRLAKATIHHMLRTLTYTGEFEWAGTRYRGTHTPLVSLDLWHRVQDLLQGRGRARTRRSKHDFAFSRLIQCGHCRCALVGEIHKGRYVYYRCSGHRGKCPERYVREEHLEAVFTDLLRTLSFDNGIMDWVADVLQRTHADAQASAAAAQRRLEAEHGTLERRLEAMYLDKLDGRVTAAFFDRKASEWRQEQARVRVALDEHRASGRHYLAEGPRLLNLARRAADRFETQPPREKRRLLDFLLSNCTWKDRTLRTEFRQPFDLLAIAATANRKRETAEGGPEAVSTNWLRRPDMNSSLGDSGIAAYSVLPSSDIEPTMTATSFCPPVAKISSASAGSTQPSMRTPVPPLAARCASMTASGPAAPMSCPDRSEALPPVFARCARGAPKHPPEWPIAL